ncbi:hypothetical protein Tco_0910145 [Tanacetum coccineum]|uniref:Uncharacterized protein n=1 Tax=Tanacetum coccineum TaxID=301880 RepID=A0ABQ5CS75_9ASTR
MFLEKTISNQLITESVAKTIWFINAPCYGNEALASPKANELTIPEQTATGKGTSNPFMAVILDAVLSLFYVDAKEHELGDLIEPPNYKATLTDPESDRSKRLIALSQSAYLDKIKRFELENSKHGNILRQEKPNSSKAQEAEYIAASKAVWMRKFVNGLGSVVRTNKEPLEMLCDNTGAIAIANEPRIIKDDDVDDMFTKLMSLTKHYEHASGIGLPLASSLM